MLAQAAAWMWAFLLSACAAVQAAAASAAAWMPFGTALQAAGAPVAAWLCVAAGALGSALAGVPLWAWLAVLMAAAIYSWRLWDRPRHCVCILSVTNHASTPAVFIWGALTAGQVSECGVQRHCAHVCLPGVSSSLKPACEQVPIRPCPPAGKPHSQAHRRVWSWARAPARSEAPGCVALWPPHCCCDRAGGRGPGVISHDQCPRVDAALQALTTVYPRYSVRAKALGGMSFADCGRRTCLAVRFTASRAAIRGVSRAKVWGMLLA